MRSRSARSIKIMSAVLLTTAVVLASAGPASAGPFDPAYRGDDNSVHAIFEWVTFATTWDTTLFETGPSIYPLDLTPPFASDDGLDMRIMLPNFIDPLPLKLMRLQMDFDGPVGAGVIVIAINAIDPFPTSWNIVGGSTGTANAHYIDVEITPNPDAEEILIFGDTPGNFVPGNFLTLEIDTVSTPEPATLSMLALGGLAVIRLRRR